MHYAGLGTEKEIAKALTSLSKAVDAGVPFSKTVSGLLMQEIGRTDLAVDLFFEDAKSSNPLSIILFQNSLVEKNAGTTQNSISNLFTSASNSAHLLDKICENDAFEVAKTFFENSPVFKQAFYKAIDILTPLANFGDTGSQELLGWLYNKGVGVEKNVDLSVSLFLKAGQKNSDFARFNLYKIGINENQTLITNSEAYEYLEKAAENNYLPAVLEMRYSHDFEEKNLELLRCAADKGDLGAIENLVRSYRLDSNEKLKYLLKGADSGSKKKCAYFFLYELYSGHNNSLPYFLQKIDVQEDLVKARKFLIRGDVFSLKDFNQFIAERALSEYQEGKLSREEAIRRLERASKEHLISGSYGLKVLYQKEGDIDLTIKYMIDIVESKRDYPELNRSYNVEEIYSELVKMLYANQKYDLAYKYASDIFEYVKQNENYSVYEYIFPIYILSILFREGKGCAKDQTKETECYTTLLLLFQKARCWDDLSDDYEDNNDEDVDDENIYGPRYFSDDIYRLTIDRLTEIISKTDDLPTKLSYINFLGYRIENRSKNKELRNRYEKYLIELSEQGIIEAKQKLAVYYSSYKLGDKEHLKAGLLYDELGDQDKRMREMEKFVLPLNFSENIADNEKLSLLQVLAEFGEVFANYYLGIVYLYGIGLEKDLDKAFRYFTNIIDTYDVADSFFMECSLSGADLSRFYKSQSYFCRGMIRWMSLHNQNCLRIYDFNRCLECHDLTSKEMDAFIREAECFINHKTETIFTMDYRPIIEASICFNLGFIFENGIMIDVDRENARNYFSRAKDLGIPSSERLL